MWHIGEQNFLYFLLSVPAVILFYILFAIRKKKAIKAFAHEDSIPRLMPLYAKYRYGWKLVLSLCALLFLIIAICRPQVPQELKSETQKGVELVIALDVSNSMLAEDILPNRLERAKRAIVQLIDKFKGDKVALIVFAGRAHTQLPITTDYEAAKMFVDMASTTLLSTQGTNLADAISLAAKSFTSEEKVGKAIILISDGEDHQPNAIEVASGLEEQGIILHTIGMGLPNGVPIPVLGKPNTFLKSRGDSIVLTKLNEQILQRLAAAGKGNYIRANNSEVGLQKVFETIQGMEKGDSLSASIASYSEKYYIFLWLALFFLLGELLLLERKNKYLLNIKLFQEEEKSIKRDKR